MFEVLLALVFLSPWLYFIGFIIYIIVQFAKGRRLPFTVSGCRYYLESEDYT